LSLVTPNNAMVASPPTSCYFLHLFIVNKSGGLVHHRVLNSNNAVAPPKLSTNDWLRIGSTFHSLHAIAAEASPVKLKGNKNASECSRLFMSLIQEQRSSGVG
jgi:Sybindin-like family